MTDHNADLQAAQAKVKELELRLAELGEQPQGLRKVTTEDLLAYQTRMVEAVRASDDDTWDAIFIEYMKDMLVREREMDPYEAIASFVRGSMRASMEFGRRIAQSSTKGSN